jgi:RHS repeat-associated protein
MGNLICRNIDITSGHTCAGSTPSGASMTYDNEGRLSSWSAASGTSASETSLYDNEGNQVLVTNVQNGHPVGTLYFDGYTETTIADGSTTTTKYYSINGQRLAMRVGGATLEYLVSDLLGNVVLALNNVGTVIAVQLYEPYGTMNYAWGTMPTAHNYTGQRLDSQSGLLYYNSRWYDPVSGQFARADILLGNAQGMNPYSYVQGNPEMMTDPAGYRATAIEPCTITCPPTSGYDPNNPLTWPVYVAQEAEADGVPGPVVVSGEVTLCVLFCDIVIPAVIVLWVASTPSDSTYPPAETASSDSSAYPYASDPFVGSSDRPNMTPGPTSGPTPGSTPQSGGSGSTSGSSGSSGGSGGGPHVATGMSDGRPPRPKIPPTPGNMGQKNFGKMIKWGGGSTGSADSIARIFDITAQDLAEWQQKGLTQDMAQQWADFYHWIAKYLPEPNGDPNPSAGGRSILMQFIAYLLGQE